MSCFLKKVFLSVLVATSVTSFAAGSFEEAANAVRDSARDAADEAQKMRREISQQEVAIVKAVKGFDDLSAEARATAIADVKAARESLAAARAALAHASCGPAASAVAKPAVAAKPAAASHNDAASNASREQAALNARLTALEQQRVSASASATATASASAVATVSTAPAVSSGGECAARLSGVVVKSWKMSGACDAQKAEFGASYEAACRNKVATESLASCAAALPLPKGAEAHK